MEPTKADFDEQRAPRFGTTNPERMQVPLWEWMIRGEGSEMSVAKLGVRILDPEITAEDDYDPTDVDYGYGPYHARTKWGASICDGLGPIWTFSRFGNSRTAHPDGRLVCVGGEHEDYYDPDFCIYNDVVVFLPDGAIEIYGYPRELFPPTDFHSATLVDEKTLILIGGLGYQGERTAGETPVYRLDLEGYAIEPLATSGDRPGWIHRHTAQWTEDNEIVVSGGKIMEVRDDKELHENNFNDYALSLKDMTWRLVTERKWRTYRFRDVEGKPFMIRPAGVVDQIYETSGMEGIPPLSETFVLIPASALLPRTLPYELTSLDEWFGPQYKVDGVPIRVKADYPEVEVVVEGDLGEARSREIAEDIMQQLITVSGRECAMDGPGS